MSALSVLKLEKIRGDSFPRAKQTVRNNEVSVKQVLTVVYPYFNSYIHKNIYESKPTRLGE